MSSKFFNEYSLKENTKGDWLALTTLTMAPDYGRIIIGVSAATGVVLLSFLLLKKFGIQGESNKKKRQAGDNVPKKVVDNVEKTTLLLPQENVQLDESPEIDTDELNLYSLCSDKDVNEKTATNIDDDEKEESICQIESIDKNQQSFIYIDEEDIGEIDLERNATKTSDKSSDKSSDENSFDVLENDRLYDHEERLNLDPEVSLPSPLDTETKDPVSLNDEINKNTTNSPEAEDRDSQKTESDIQTSTEVLFTCLNSPDNVTKEDINTLVELLKDKNNILLATILDSLIKVTAFTHNIKNLREIGCPELLTEQTKTLVSSQVYDEKILVSIFSVLTNLSLDPLAQQQISDVIPVLIEVVKSKNVSENLLLSTLRLLVNLSAEKVYHNMYRDLIQTLYLLLDSGSPLVQLLSLKVLVNLSLNSEIVQDLLTAKAPDKLIHLLDVPSSQDLTLRCMTMLSNIYTVICTTEYNVGQKIFSEEAMFSSLTDEHKRDALQKKVFKLTQHDDEDLRYEASKLYNYLS